MALNVERILTAIDLIIKDVDKKYDECMVDLFIEYLSEEVETKTCLYRTVVDRLKFYLDHKAFVMLNQTRAYRIFVRILDSLNPGKPGFYQVETDLESIWKTLDVVVLNNNLSALTVIFELLECWMTERLCSWWTSLRIEPSIIIPSNQYEIKDVISLVRYYIKTCNNYHTKAAAERLFTRIMRTAEHRRLPPEDPILVSIRQTIRDLIVTETTSMTCIIMATFEETLTTPGYTERFTEYFAIEAILQENFDRLVSEPGTKLNNICKCLAAISSSKLLRQNLAKLKSKNRLDAMIIYLTHMEHKDDEIVQLLLTHTLYPLMTICEGDDVEILVQKLLATREEKNFIDRNTNPKTITLCLIQLNHIFSRKIPIGRYSFSYSQRTVLLILNCLTNFIKQHYKSMAHYKNILECCSIISLLEQMYRVSEEATIFQSLESLHKTLDSIEYTSDHMKPIIMDLIKLISSTHRKFSHITLTEDTDKIFFNRTVSLGFRYEDHDILNEIALFFCTNRPDLTNFKEKDKNEYIRLIWHHMYRRVKDTEHRELLGHLVGLLIDLENWTIMPILDMAGIKKHFDVPTAIADTLIEKATYLPTVERVIESLDYSYSKGENQSGCSTYVNLLDSLAGRSKMVQTALDRITHGLCVTVCGEARLSTRLKALKIIHGLATEMITNCDDNHITLTRFAKTGILETLYKINKGSLYSNVLFERSKLVAATIGQIAKHVNLKKVMEDSFENIDLRNEEYCVQLAKFLCDESTSDRAYEVGNCNVTKASSIVDDIINFSRLSDGISDCY